MMPKCSVIIPNYNHGPFLNLRIESVLRQTYQDFEIILMDDCSTDNSRTIIESYRSHPKISKIILNEKNSGSPFGLWKKGFDMAKADWIWIAESDDIAESGFLEEAVKAIEQFPLLDIFYCDSFIVDENGKKSPEKFSERKNQVFNTQKWNVSYYNKGINEINECLKFDCTINNMSSAVLRKSLVTDEAGQMNEFYFHGDWFFLLKTSLSGNIYYCNKPLNHYRIHDRSHSNNQTTLFLRSRSECFRILSLLYYNKNITDKKGLLDHFAYNCLGFGLITDGIIKGWHIMKSYLKADRKLALKIIIKIAAIKVFRIKRPFFVAEIKKKY